MRRLGETGWPASPALPCFDGQMAADAPDKRPPEADLVAAALSAIAAGATLGGTVIVVGLAVLRGSLAGALPLVLFAGLVGGAVSAWVAAAVVDDTWRRAVTATLGAVGALMLAGLAAPADLAGGRIGLAVYALLLAAGAGWAFRTARRAGGP